MAIYLKLTENMNILAIGLYFSLPLEINCLLLCLLFSPPLPTQSQYYSPVLKSLRG